VPASTEFHPDRNLIVHRIHGEFTTKLFRATLNEELNHPEFRPAMNGLWDLTHADASKVTADDIQAMVRHMRQNIQRRGSGYRVAIVAPDDLAFGLSRMYETQTANLDREIRVVRDEATAEAWLAKPRARKGEAD
jgi:hypothetical protein